MAGMEAPQWSQWPIYHYVLRGVKRSIGCHSTSRCLPITPDIMSRLHCVFKLYPKERQFEATLLWAACCVGFFGFMRSGEFTSSHASPSAVLFKDLAVDSHTDTRMVRLFLSQAKNDPFKKGILIFLGKSGKAVCPVNALLGYVAVRPVAGGPLFIWEDMSPLSRDQFVHKVKAALQAANVNSESYSGHSFRIGAATTAAAAGVPADTIKMLGRWSSDAYQLYVRTPRESLAAVARCLV